VKGRLVSTACVLVAHALLLALPTLVASRAELLLHPRAIASIGLLLLLSVLEPAVLRGSPARVSLRGRAGVLALASGLGLLFTTWGALLEGAAAAQPWCWLGLGAAAAGIGLRLVAIRDLGPGFTSALDPVPGRPLVVRGIYGRVRHPSDLGLLLTSSGIAVLGESLLAGLVVAGIVLPSVVLRFIEEERSLFEHFGAEHRAYRERVGAVLPILGRG
jgi:protein-S-isoprenylcysteine O-methyltransferase Ste14